jgi:flagellar hook-associated protein 1 FlgK
MGTISGALSLITGALDADQSALDVVANNVANANTTGYTEEKASFKENDSITINGETVGQGATETGSTSQRDSVLLQRLNQQQQLESSSSTRLSALNDVQSLFKVNANSSSSSGGDIGSDITSFFDSFSSMESEPSSSSYREAVLSAASTLASDVSSSASSLNEQKAAVDQEASSVASQVNALTTSIAQLNKQITATSPDSDAGPLEDQRQTDISSLSKLIGINQVSEKNNGLQITTTSGRVLVDGDTNFDLTTGTSDGVTHFYVGATDVTSELADGGGQLGGYLTARDTDIAGTLASLDQLAYSISTTVNSQNASGTDLDGAAGSNIFSEPTTASGSALAMSVTMTDSDKIAASTANEGTGGSTNVMAMAGLASSAFVSGKTPSNYYSSIVSTLGTTVSEVSTEQTAQKSSVSQLQTQVDSTSGVNLNDEAASLTTYERSYQAASHVFSILNGIYAMALNLGETTTVS